MWSNSKNSHLWNKQFCVHKRWQRTDLKVCPDDWLQELENYIKKATSVQGKSAFKGNHGPSQLATCVNCLFFLSKSLRLIKARSREGGVIAIRVCSNWAVLWAVKQTPSTHLPLSGWRLLILSSLRLFYFNLAHLSTFTLAKSDKTNILLMHLLLMSIIIDLYVTQFKY